MQDPIRKLVAAALIFLRGIAVRVENSATDARRLWASAWPGALMGLAMNPTFASDSKPECDTHLLTEFSSTLAVAAKQDDYKPLRDAFGRDLEDLVGLPCDIASLESILRDAGFGDVARISHADGGMEIVGYIPASIFSRLLGRRYRAIARIGSSNGSTQNSSIGPIK
ncbi:MAG: hypothetical protein QNJ16_10015 [Rhodobacter sp.]|nr:hypothetical protein [Rhodobacter sp.]